MGSGGGLRDTFSVLVIVKSVCDIFRDIYTILGRALEAFTLELHGEHWVDLRHE